MRGLKLAVGVMTVLIVLGVAVIAVTIVRRLSAPREVAGGEVAGGEVRLAEPAGTRIAGIAALPDRLAVLLQGGGADRVLVLDARTLRPIGQLRVGE